MKLLFILSLLVSCLSGSATIYYVDPNGSDGAAGTSTVTAWATVAKINGRTFSPGDQILFKRGGVWNESLVPSSSGTAGNTITFGAYGTGDRPLFTGFTTVTGFSHSGNIWTKTISGGLAELNTVMIDGVLKAKARYPNTGYLTLTGGTLTSLTTDLTGTPSFTGGEVVIRTSHFTTRVERITSQVGGTLNFAFDDLYNIPWAGATGYFIENDDDCLDLNGEWTYNTSTGVLKIYSTTTPTVKISNQTFNVYAKQKHYLTFNNINFEGSDFCGIRLDTCNFNTIQNCTLTNNGEHGIMTWKCSNAIIRSDSVVNSWSMGMYLAGAVVLTGTTDNSIVDSCYIKNSGTKAGMANVPYYVQYCGMWLIGDDNKISHNRIDSSGYNGIQFYGKRTLVTNNYLTNFCFVKDDGAAIYTGVGFGFYPIDLNDGSEIAYNIIINGISAPGGVNPSDIPTAACVYLDDYSRLFYVHHNLMKNGVGRTMILNQADSCIIHNNNILSTKAAYGVGFYGLDPVSSIQDFKNNVVVQTNRGWATLYREGGRNFSGIDSNYYFKAPDTTSVFYIQSIAGYWPLSTWQAQTGMDLHSTLIMPTIVTSIPEAYFNASIQTVTQTLDGSYYDAYGNTYVNQITLTPYQNIILFKNYADHINGGRIR